jgi:hypothetical protein
VGAGPGDHLERGVGDELGEPVAHDQLLAAPDLDEPDEVPVRGRQVSGQRVLGLVEVVVRVEDGEVDSLCHVHVVLRREARLTWLGSAVVRIRQLWLPEPPQRSDAESDPGAARP